MRSAVYIGGACNSQNGYGGSNIHSRRRISTCNSYEEKAE